MRILQITSKLPYPEKDGGALAVEVFTQQLMQAGCSVKMLAMNTKKHFTDEKSIPEEFRKKRDLETIRVDNSLKPFKALLALVKDESYNISRFQSEKFHARLKKILLREKFDIIQLEGIFVTSYISLIREYSRAPIILRAHNIEWKIWHRLAKKEKKGLKKWYLNKLATQLRKYEEEIFTFCDGIIAFTVNDVNTIIQTGCKVPVEHIPFGIDIARYSHQGKKIEPSLFYIGALDWLPNLQGIDWFLTNVWNKIHSRHPDVVFHIAGRNMPESLRKSNYPNVNFHGEAENAISFMNDYGIMLVPLLAGSGVRVKIIEGMALGKPIVTTSTGIEGIECKWGSDILVADSPEDFSLAVCRCLEDTTFAEQMGKNGRQFVSENHDIRKITNRLIEFYKERIKLKSVN